LKASPFYGEAFLCKTKAMHAEAIRTFALSLGEVEEGFPFGEDVLVMKVKGKIFLLLSLDSQPLQFNVKCLPDEAIQLREEYPESILPGYHMNKKHWNTVIVDGQLKGHQLQQFIINSYQLVRGKK
jgi:predicted DNA-binding protein (MmcQ/YjbR family)